MIITLERDEIEYAASIGARRQIDAVLSGKKDSHGFNGDGWGIHIDGACGELAVAKSIGCKWDATVNTFKVGGDVQNYQVRTRSKSYYDLIIREDDRDFDIFILVIGTIPTFNVVGWITGILGKRSCWIKTFGNRPPAYFVPQSRLYPMTELM